MQDSLSGRAAELAHLTDLIRTSLSLADAAIPLINEQLNGFAEMGIDNLELEGPRIYSQTAGWSPAFDDEQIIYAAALTMPGGLGCTTWSTDEYAMRYGDSHHEPPALRERFVAYDKLPPIVRAMIPGVAPKLIAELLSSFNVLIERWRQAYNTVRPHSALGYRPPAPEARQPCAAAAATR